MSGFVELPNLPNHTDTLLIGEKYAEYFDFPLKKLHIKVLYVPDNPLIDPRLAGHADLSVFHAGGERLYLAPSLKGTELYAKLLKLGADPVIPAIRQGKEYPDDVQLNACAAGSRLIYAPRRSAEEIVDYFTNKWRTMPMISRQGYAKCSVCVVDERSIITSDPGLAAVADTNGLQVLRIRPGFITLPGFACGFIGGAAFRLSRDQIAFTGRLDRHPDQEKILDFLRTRGFDPVFLTDRDLFDVGGAVPLTEKE